MSSAVTLKTVKAVVRLQYGNSNHALLPLSQASVAGVCCHVPEAIFRLG